MLGEWSGDYPLMLVGWSGDCPLTYIWREVCSNGLGRSHEHSTSLLTWLFHIYCSLPPFPNTGEDELNWKVVCNENH